MKALVTEFHALQIRDLARLHLIPFSKLEWVWRTPKGAQETTVPITVLPDALQLNFPTESGRALQMVRLTHSCGSQGGKRPWFICPTCPRRVGVLYHKHGLPFRCRRCWELAYPSQYQLRDQSYGRRHQYITQRERDRLRVGMSPSTRG
jgi:hypothetical protein